MTERAPDWLRSALARWVGAVQAHALWVVLLAVIAAVAMLHFTVSHLSIDTDNEHLLAANLPFRQASLQLNQQFPQLSHQIVIVIDGDSPDLAAQAQQRLVAALQAQPQLFSAIFAPETDPFFRRNGLLYLSPKQLESLSDKVTQAQPFLGALNSDPSLHGLFFLLGNALTQPPSSGFDLNPVLRQIGSTFQAAQDHRFYQMSWRNLMGATPGEDEPNRRFIALSPHVDYTQLLPAAHAINAIRDLGRELQLDAAHGLRMRLTGEVPMEHEELQTASQGAGLALGSAMVMVAILLWLGLRSLRLVAAAVLTLVYGLLTTAAFAALAVGHLNLISVAFGVLYVGLGIDYALYLCMQLRELMGKGMPVSLAVPEAAAEVGGFMFVCAATTSLGFLAFIPTAFTAIAELGLIAGAGMFISLFLSLSLLPALIALAPPSVPKIKARASGSSAALAKVLDLPYRHARALWVGAAVLAVGAASLLPRLSFDFNPLDLRDPHTESVATFRELLADPNIPALTLSAMASDPADAKQLAARLSALPLVKQTLQLSDFVPVDQQTKLSTLSDLSFAMGPDFVGSAAPVIKGDEASDTQAVADLGRHLAEWKPVAGLQQTAASLRQQVESFQLQLRSHPADRSSLLGSLRGDLLGALPDQIQGIKTALTATAVTPQDLPADLIRRWRADDGHLRIEIWPRERLDNNPAMERFVDQVHAVAPGAVGPPVMALESGRTMVVAFRQAFIYSFIAITLLLLVLLRSLTDTLLVLIPLAMAGLLTAAGTVLLRIPFNFANIIALPLILGVGVDYGVYIVQRGRRAASAHVNILQTSTARAVLFGALITMANFGNLALAKHPGMVSMGLLLTVGLAMTLLSALVLLPSLLTLGYGPKR